MTVRVWASTSLLLGAISACAVANPTVHHLEQAKALAQAGRFEELAALNASCTGTDAGCAQLHLLEGDACLRVAETSHDIERRRTLLDCGIAHYSAAATAAQDRQVDPDKLRVETMDAIARRRDLARDRLEAQRLNGTLQQSADAAVRHPPTRSAGAVFLADSLVNAVQLLPAGQGCEDLVKARTQLASAAQASGPWAVRARALQRSLPLVAASHRCQP